MTGFGKLLSVLVTLYVIRPFSTSKAAHYF